MENRLTDDLKCQICFEDFDCKSRKPRIFTNCGHSLCDACLGKLASNQLNKKSMKCPTCRKETNYGSTTEFGTNFALMKAIESISKLQNSLNETTEANSKLKKKLKESGETTCPVHKRCENQLCIDPDCKLKPLNCFLCLLENHFKCRKAFQHELGQAQSKLIFESPILNSTLYKKSLKETIEKYRKLTFKKLSRLFEKFQADIIRNAKAPNVDDLIANRSLFSVLLKDFLPAKETEILIKRNDSRRFEQLLKLSSIESALRMSLENERFSDTSGILYSYLNQFPSFNQTPTNK
jgi:hypothetical protein